mmetsp:Transcript_40605/g.131469  ORF Transcript_40605/g.131469 Transcript_40605/m.131469 type:complete len:278 (-) Transcript_40605:134-967(-)
MGGGDAGLCHPSCEQLRVGDAGAKGNGAQAARARAVLCDDGSDLGFERGRGAAGAGRRAAVDGGADEEAAVDESRDGRPEGGPGEDLLESLLGRGAEGRRRHAEHAARLAQPAEERGVRAREGGVRLVHDGQREAAEPLRVLLERAAVQALYHRHLHRPLELQRAAPAHQPDQLRVEANLDERAARLLEERAAVDEQKAAAAGGELGGTLCRGHVRLAASRREVGQHGAMPLAEAVADGGQQRGLVVSQLHRWRCKAEGRQLVPAMDRDAVLTWLME